VALESSIVVEHRIGAWRSTLPRYEWIDWKLAESETSFPLKDETGARANSFNAESRVCTARLICVGYKV